MERAAQHGLFEIKQRNLRSRIAYDDLCVKQTNQRDKQADAYGHRPFQAKRDNIEHRLTDVGQRHQDKEDTFHANRCQRHLPTVTHLFDHRKGKKRVEAHARRQGERKVGKSRHQKRSEA